MKKIFFRSALTFIAIATCSVVATAGPKRRDLRADRRDIRRDTRDIRHDRRDIRGDVRERRADIRDFRQDKKEGGPRNRFQIRPLKDRGRHPLPKPGLVQKPLPTPYTSPMGRELLADS